MISVAMGKGEMMDDLISRQAAIDALYSVDEYNSRSVKAIKQLPPAEPDIVRCGECKHLMPNGRCEEFADYLIKLSASDFCSQAVRREVTT